jgi:hypothetical protein
MPKMPEEAVVSSSPPQADNKQQAAIPRHKKESEDAPLKIFIYAELFYISNPPQR